MAAERYIGLISGTSMDAVDCALVDFSQGRPRLEAFHELPMPARLKERILGLCQDGRAQVPELGEMDILLGRLFARAVEELLQERGLSPAQVAAIGSHGQTVRHQPPLTGDPSRVAFTLQLGDPNTICELTGITTVADFRRRDMAAGGQGAPLVPAFHREIFYSAQHDRFILNLGGIANLTVLPRDRGAPIPAFDTGPANVLLDAWMRQHQGRDFDADGAWAASGTAHAELLDHFMAEDYFRLRPPKSTGRELFDARWLRRKLETFPHPVAARDVQATLVELTSRSVAEQVGSGSGELIVCGGGARNPCLLASLAARLPGLRVAPSSEFGLAADSVEAVAFAWMARLTLAGEALDLGEITGARHANILGGIYRAR